MDVGDGADPDGRVGVPPVAIAAVGAIAVDEQPGVVVVVPGDDLARPAFFVRPAASPDQRLAGVEGELDEAAVAVAWAVNPESDCLV